MTHVSGRPRQAGFQALLSVAFVVVVVWLTAQRAPMEYLAAALVLFAVVLLGLPRQHGSHPHRHLHPLRLPHG